MKQQRTKKNGQKIALRNALTANAPVIIINGVIIFNSIKVSGV